MAALRGLLLLTLLQACVALELQVSPSQQVLRGSDVHLGCTFSVVDPSVKPSYFSAIWYFKGRQIVTYDNIGLSVQPRMSFNGQAAGDGDVSLNISNVAVSDDGTYTCSVIYNMERKEKDVRLRIMVSPLVTVDQVSSNGQITLLCMATGFFPPDIEIKWIKNEKVLPRSDLSEITRSEDLTYSAKGSFTFSPKEDDWNGTFFCRVRHFSLQEPLLKDLQLLHPGIHPYSNM
ncbi:tapasin-related protein-like [Hyperolius riggenbachi]|uniref:tapasin-related protein-like n=1 Tax=Hyperolius riggenbachi TaxID=752182 RepID=UPI0035A3BAB1